MPLRVGASIHCLRPIFASGDEQPVSLQAGPGDAEVVLLQLPVKTAEYRSIEQTA